MNKFSKEYIKKNFRVKKFCKHLDYILDKKKEIKTQPPLYMFILYYSLLEKVEKFSEPIKITKKSSVEDQAALKKGNKYKVVWNYEDIDKEFTNEKNDEFLQYIMRESGGGFYIIQSNVLLKIRKRRGYYLKIRIKIKNEPFNYFVYLFFIS